MANQVYANGRELACKSGSGKTICSMPDVCFTPPENPATPPGVPVPYPNTGMASDTNDGSTSVQISGEQIMLKDKSAFKKSSGDEAGSAAKKGVITSTNTGPVYFTAWSMDVKVEGENAVRHLDMTTGNHGSPAATAAVPWPFTDSMTPEDQAKCAGDKKKEEEACKDYQPNNPDGKDACAAAGLDGACEGDSATQMNRTTAANENPCIAARRCRLVEYGKDKDGIKGCCPAQTGDHIIPKSSFFVDAYHDGNGQLMPAFAKNATGEGGYKMSKAPCMCLEGGSCSGSHGLRHAHHKAINGGFEPGKHRSFDAEATHCAAGAKAVAPQCDEGCIKAQLEQGHSKMGDTKGDVKYSPTGKNFIEDKPALEAAIRESTKKIAP